MSEKIYARLLRLYPSHFRKQYEAEALQLIRDRLRDERGFYKRARLWWDLLTDIFVALPSAHRNSYAVTESASLSFNASEHSFFQNSGRGATGTRLYSGWRHDIAHPARRLCIVVK